MPPLEGEHAGATTPPQEGCGRGQSGWGAVKERVLQGEFAMFFWKCEQSRVSLCDRRLNLYPWGFNDQALEARYREYFWLTFTQNFKYVLLFLYTTCTCVFFVSFLYHLATNGWDWGTTLADAFATVGHAFVGHFFAKQHIPSLFKRGFAMVFRAQMTVMPFIMCYQACLPSTNQATLAGSLLMISTAGTWCCPYYIHHMANVALLSFVPIFWTASDGSRSVSTLIVWATGSVYVFVFTIFFSGWLCVHRRREWIHRRYRSSAAQRASGTPARSRSRSPSPQRAGRESLQHRRSQSPPALPRLLEGREDTAASLKLGLHID